MRQFCLLFNRFINAFEIGVKIVIQSYLLLSINIKQVRLFLNENKAFEFLKKIIINSYR